MPAKTCRVCGETKLLTEFGTNPKSSDGRDGRCKGCISRSVSATRKRNKEYYAKYGLARDRALLRLRDLYPELFTELMAEELAKLFFEELDVSQ